MALRIPPAEVIDHLSAARAGDSGKPVAGGRARGTGTDHGGGGASLTARPRRLSRRQVRRRITVERSWETDRWIDEQGMAWRVVNAHRKDDMAALQGPGGRPRFASFSQLAKHYRLVEGS